MDPVERRPRDPQADDVQPDQVLFRAFSPGGTSLAPDKDFIAADTASQVVFHGGLGTWSRIDLGKKLVDKTAFVRPEIDEMRESLAGGADKAISRRCSS